MSTLTKFLKRFCWRTTMPAVDFTDSAAALAAVIADGKAILDKLANAEASEAQVAKLSSDLATANDDLASAQATVTQQAADLKALHDQLTAALNPAPAQSAG
jgi:hypothetical protein